MLGESRDRIVVAWIVCVLACSGGLPESAHGFVLRHHHGASRRASRSRYTLTCRSAIKPPSDNKKNDPVDSVLDRNDDEKEDDPNVFRDALTSLTGPIFSQESPIFAPLEQFRDFVKNTLKKLFEFLTQLSLQDYKWRSEVFKENEADRKVQESLARMMGEDASYVRPMDASDEKIGPLGRAERMAVSWLSRVIEEEGKRAETILESDGAVVRPMDAPEKDVGPLAYLERKAVEFLDAIRKSEQERASSKTLRPKDMEESKRGPLGQAEAKVVEALRNLRESEMLRYEQSKQRGGEVVRPIDVPGPLGEFEMAVTDVVRAEQQRFKDREHNEGRVVRPKDASLKGPLGEAELGAMVALEKLTEEEQERLRNIRRVLQEKRPMENERDSFLGVMEAVVVGILRAPQLLLSVVERVKELMESETLEESDQNKLNTSYKLSTKKDDEGKASDKT